MERRDEDHNTILTLAEAYVAVTLTGASWAVTWTDLVYLGGSILYSGAGHSEHTEAWLIS